MLRPPARLGDLEVGELLIRRHVLVHIDARDKDAAEHKWEMLVFMLQKLYALAAGRVREDNPDSLVSQEVLLPGHLWGVILKEKLGEWLESVHTLVTKELRYGKGAQERRGAAPRRRRVAARLPRVLRQAQGRASTWARSSRTSWRRATSCCPVSLQLEAEFASWFACV